MDSIKETNESGCRNMPGTGIHMIVVEFISSINREIILSYYSYYSSNVENFFLHKTSMLYFCLHKKISNPCRLRAPCYLGTFGEFKKEHVFSFSSVTQVTEL